MKVEKWNKKITLGDVIKKKIMYFYKRLNK